jgi:hypothetical protein
VNPAHEKSGAQDPKARGDWTRVLREAAPYLGIGTSMAATLLLCLGGGYWLDGKLGTRPVFFLAGAAFGLFAAFYSFSKTVKGRRP